LSRMGEVPLVDILSLSNPFLPLYGRLENQRRRTLSLLWSRAVRLPPLGLSPVVLPFKSVLPLHPFAALVSLVSLRRSDLRSSPSYLFFFSAVPPAREFQSPLPLVSEILLSRFSFWSVAFGFQRGWLRRNATPP